MTRGDGKTTGQMLNASFRAIYVWCNSFIYYPKLLAYHLDRSDLIIVRPSWLTEDRLWLGQRFTDIVIDHATVVSRQQVAHAISRLAHDNVRIVDKTGRILIEVNPRDLGDTRLVKIITNKMVKEKVNGCSGTT